MEYVLNNYVHWMDAYQYTKSLALFSRLRLTRRYLESLVKTRNCSSPCESKAEELGQEIWGLMAYVQTHANL